MGHAEDADNLLQETLFNAYQGLESFQKEAQFSTWIYCIALNVSRSHLRRFKTVKHQRLQSLDALYGDRDGFGGCEPAGGEPAPDDLLAGRELQMLIQQAIQALPPDLRQVVVLKDVENNSYEEIAGMIDCPVGTIKSRLFKAREILRNRLKRYLA